MKKAQTEMLVVGVVALAAAYFLLRKKAAPARSNAEYAQPVYSAGDTNGWQYFTDGTSISPRGEYYRNGQMIYAPGGIVSAS